jgi:hypothetical protein
VLTGNHVRSGDRLADLSKVAAVDRLSQRLEDDAQHLASAVASEQKPATQVNLLS